MKQQDLIFHNTIDIDRLHKTAMQLYDLEEEKRQMGQTTLMLTDIISTILLCGDEKNININTIYMIGRDMSHCVTLTHEFNSLLKQTTTHFEVVKKKFTFFFKDYNINVIFMSCDQWYNKRLWETCRDYYVFVEHHVYDW